MLYILNPQTPQQGAVPFERYYLDTETFIENRNGWRIKSPIGVEPFEPGLIDHLKTQVKLVLKGNEVMNQNYSLYFVEQPWRSVVLETSQERAGLISSKFDMATYFYRRRIGIFGGPGTGKSCLSRALANFLNIQWKIVADTPYEFASTYIARYGAPEFSSQIWLMLRQWQREDDIGGHKTVMISDCPHPLGYVYAVDSGSKKGPGDYKYLPWLHEMALKGMNSFDVKVFLPFKEERCIQDGIRLHNPEEGRRISNRIKTFLDETGSGYMVYDGDTTSIEALASQVFEVNPLAPL